MTDSSDRNPQTRTLRPSESWFVSLPDTLQQSLLTIPPSENYFIAYSGGLDSSLLLVLAARYLVGVRRATLTAIHVHHGLSDYADDWQAHCEKFCHRLGVSLIVRRVELKDKKKGVEDAARVARYKIFEDVLPSGGVLLQGHHMNDQAETVLLRLMRGAGPKGVAGIPQARALNQSLIFRPFLSVLRSELYSVANTLSIEWVEDDSNLSRDYDRNFIRHDVIPELEKRWQGAVRRLAVSANHCRESAELEDELAKIDLQAIAQEGFGPALSIEGLLQLSQARQRNAVRYWLRSLGVGFPGEKRFQRIWSELLVAREDASPLIEWSLGAVRRYQNALYVQTIEELTLATCFDSAEVSIPYHSNCLSREDESNIDVLFESTIMGRQYSLSVIKSLHANAISKGVSLPGVISEIEIALPAKHERMTIKFRQGGEQIKAVGKAHHRPIKKYFNDHSVPPWLRDSVPLLYYNECLVAIGDLLVSDGFQGDHGSANLEISWSQMSNHNQL